MLSSATSGVAVGAGVVGRCEIVGRGVGAQAPSTNLAPHDSSMTGGPPSLGGGGLHAADPHDVRRPVPQPSGPTTFTLESMHQPLRSWLKPVAQKSPPMFMTLLTTQSPMSWLNASAPQNIAYIVVTPEVSHAPMSSLKDDAPLNKSDMSVTPDTSHVEM